MVSELVIGAEGYQNHVKRIRGDALRRARAGKACGAYPAAPVGGISGLISYGAFRVSDLRKAGSRSGTRLTPSVRARIFSAVVRVVVIVTLLVAAIAIFRGLAASRPEPQRIDADELVRRVIYFDAHPVSVARQWTGFGTARAIRSADVPARISAPVVERSAEIERGVFVTAGTLLVRLDDADLREQINVSEAADQEFRARLAELDEEAIGLAARHEIHAAQEALAESELRRLRAARVEGAATEREVDAAEQSLYRFRLERTLVEESQSRLPARRHLLEAQRAAEQARRRIAEDQIARAVITAPIDGVLQEIDVEIGEQVAAGSRVARIVDRRRVEVALQFPATARMTIRPGDEVRVTSIGRQRSAWAGRIDRIAPEDDPATRTFSVFVELNVDDASAELPAPGQFVRGEVTSSQRELRSLVPRRAILGDRVMTIGEDGRLVGQRVEVDFQVEQRYAETGLADVAWSVLREPLAPGTRVVAEASRRHFDGMPVEAVHASEAGPRVRADRAIRSGDAHDAGGSGQ